MDLISARRMSRVSRLLRTTCLTRRALTDFDQTIRFPRLTTVQLLVLRRQSLLLLAQTYSQVHPSRPTT